MELFCCPVCGEILQREEHTYRCAHGHCYDRAKSGYVNLLLPNQKHSKVPGDNKLMVRARSGFLNRGYYRPLADAVCEEAVTALAERRALGKGEKPVLLDCGCGEGYYTALVESALREAGESAALFGVDISKLAADAAAKRTKTVSFAAASVFRLPVPDASCDLLLHLFAPYCGEEFRRVLKPDGCYLMVIPGERHLWSLKRAVYERPYPNEVKDTQLPGFSLLRRRTVAYTLSLDNPDDILHLFQMTPYYYKTSREDAARVERLSALETEIQFELLLYRRA